MIHVATYSETGPFPGRVVQLRPMEGPQRWRVALTTVKANGQKDEHTITASGPVLLSQMTQQVMTSIHEMCEPGELLRAARMDFYIHGPSRRKRRR